MASSRTRGHKRGLFGPITQSPQPPCGAAFSRFPPFQGRSAAHDERGLWSPREDIGTVDQKFKKNYLDEKNSLEEMEIKYTQWENLMRQLFIRKR